jgi:hypothetical protein
LFRLLNVVLDAGSFPQMFHLEITHHLYILVQNRVLIRTLTSLYQTTETVAW